MVISTRTGGNMETMISWVEGVEPVAVASLTRRGLVSTGSSTWVNGALPDVARQRGALLGVAVGDSLSALTRGRPPIRGLSPAGLAVIALSAHNAPVGVPTRQTLLAAQAWRSHQWSAPSVLSQRLASAFATSPGTGRALRAMAAQRARGIPWFDAGVPSFGDAALPRAIAVGAVFAGDVELAITAGAIDAAVSHADPRATAASGALAAVVALLAQPARADIVSIVRNVAEHVNDRHVRDALEAAVALGAVTPAIAAKRFGSEPLADTTLGLAVWTLLHAQDPVGALTALALVRRSATLLAVAGALLGAAFGAHAFPSRWRDHLQFGDELCRVIDGAPRTRGVVVDHASIWLLLDRSGSMASIASDVEGGIDTFVAAQAQIEGADANLTVVQFDGHDLHDVLIDAVPVAHAPSMSGRFRPRGSTPLYDALALLLDRAEARTISPTDQLVVLFTDGLENASRRWTRDGTFRRITRLQQAGWTFVFMGANQDSYAEGARLGFRDGSVSNFHADQQGVEAAYRGLDRATAEWRRKDPSRRHREGAEFWGGHNEGEQR